MSLNPPSDVRPETTEKIFHDFERSLYWRETFIEPEARSFTAVTVRKFILILYRTSFCLGVVRSS